MKRTPRPQHVDTPEKCTCHEFFGCTHYTTIETQTYQARKLTIQLEIQEVHTTSFCVYCRAQKDVTTYDFVMDGMHYQYATLDEARARLKDFMSW